MIGVYEPLIFVSGGDATRVTSRAAEPGLPLLSGAGYHAACHESPSFEAADGA